MTAPTPASDVEQRLRAALLRRGAGLKVDASSPPPRAQGAPPRGRSWATAVAGAAAAAVVVGLVIGTNARHSERTIRPAASTPVAATPPAGTPVATTAGPSVAFALTPTATGSPIRRTGLEYVRGAGDDAGPFGVVIRAPGGSFAYHSAVVTWPAPALTGTEPVEVGLTAGLAGHRFVSWTLAGAPALVVGDLPRAHMVAIAAATTIVDGRPVVVPPDGLVVTYSGHTEPSVVRSLRYGGVEFEDLGGTRLAAMVFTEVSDGVEVELDALRIERPRTYLVGNRPAVVRPLANGALSFELRPGLYASVGWSGSSRTDELLDILERIASTGVELDEAQWVALHPQVISFEPDGTLPTVVGTSDSAAGTGDSTS